MARMGAQLGAQVAVPMAMLLMVQTVEPRDYLHLLLDYAHHLVPLHTSGTLKHQGNCLHHILGRHSLLQLV
jgi:hypothetical protein